MKQVGKMVFLVAFFVLSSAFAEQYSVIGGKENLPKKFSAFSAGVEYLGGFNSTLKEQEFFAAYIKDMGKSHTDFDKSALLQAIGTMASNKKAPSAHLVSFSGIEKKTHDSSWDDYVRYAVLREMILTGACDVELFGYCSVRLPKVGVTNLGTKVEKDGAIYVQVQSYNYKAAGFTQKQFEIIVANMKKALGIDNQIASRAYSHNEVVQKMDANPKIKEAYQKASAYFIGEAHTDSEKELLDEITEAKSNDAGEDFSGVCWVKLEIDNVAKRSIFLIGAKEKGTGTGILSCYNSRTNSKTKDIKLKVKTYGKGLSLGLKLNNSGELTNKFDQKLRLKSSAIGFIDSPEEVIDTYKGIKITGSTAVKFNKDDSMCFLIVDPVEMDECFGVNLGAAIPFPFLPYRKIDGPRHYVLPLAIEGIANKDQYIGGEGAVVFETIELEKVNLDDEF